MTVLCLTRDYAAPRERVFAAWTDEGDPRGNDALKRSAPAAAKAGALPT
jgi:hypothetical protein